MVSPSSSFWSQQRVLVTGHTGFKGGWLSLWLSKLGAQVVGLSLPPETRPNFSELALTDQSINHEIGDIRTLDTVLSVFDRWQPSIVFHLAAQSLVRPSYEDPVGTYATNVMGTAHILEGVRQSDTVAATIIVTSDKCYENKEWHWAYRENEAMGGYDPYSSSKGCAELVTSAWRRSFSNATKQTDSCSRIASVRAGNVIGGGDWSKDRLIPDLVRDAERSTSTEIRYPLAVRPWQHVLDPLSGYIVLAERLASKDGPQYAEPWNFGPNEEDCRTVAEVANIFSNLWTPRASWRHVKVEQEKHEAGLLKVDSSKARVRLDWLPRLRLPIALEWTTAWYLGHLDGQDCRKLSIEQIMKYEEFLRQD